MKTSPKITVLIPTFNRGIYMKECLDSIFSQSLPPIQIIVVNDCSTDPVKDICESYGNKTIEYIESNQQLGKSEAINLGLAKVTGEYVWIFDDDDVALPDALARFVGPLEKDSSFGFSYSSFYFTANRKDSKLLGEVISELKVPDFKEKGFLISLLEANFLGGAALFARTSCYKEVGLFDPELLRSQDYEMAIRITRRYKGIRVPGSPTFHYRQHEGIRGSSRDRFTVDHNLSKWLEYNQIFFRKLYRELPLEEYLLPRNSIETNKRQALLQRIAIMARKLLFPEVISDLRLLAQLDDPTPFTTQEYGIVRTMIIESPYDREGGIYDDIGFFDEIQNLSQSSATLRLLRARIFRAVLARFRKTPKLSEISHVLSRFFYLYFPIKQVRT